MAAFISFTEGKSYITLSNNLVKQLNIKNGMRIKLLPDPVAQEPRLWIFHLTENTRNGSKEIKKVQSGKGFAYRINSLEDVNELAKAFNVEKGKTLRLYIVSYIIPPKNKIEKEVDSEKITIYLLEDVPFYIKPKSQRKFNAGDEDIESWLKEHDNLIKRFILYLITPTVRFLLGRLLIHLNKIYNMPININSKNLKNQFLEHMEKFGCKVRRVSGHAEVYTINTHKVNVRCRTKEKDIGGDREFWYSFDFDVECEYVVFITTPECCVLMKKSELIKIKDKLYQAKKNKSTCVFDIEWDNAMLTGKSGTYIENNMRSFDANQNGEMLPRELIN